MFNFGKGYTRFLVTVAILVFFGFVGYVVLHFLQPIVFGLFFYYSARPIHRRLDNYLPHRVSVWSSAVVIIIPFLILILITVNLVAHDALQFLNHFGVGSDGQKSVLESAVQDAENVMSSGDVYGTLTQTAQNLMPIVDRLGEVFIDFIIMISVVYYMLKGSGRVTSWFFDRYDETGVYREFFDAVDYDLQRILFGNTLTAFAIGMVGVVLYNVFNLFAPTPTHIPYPSISGALMGVGSLVPVIGMKIVYVPVGAVIGLHIWEAGHLSGMFVWLIGYEVLSLVFVDSIPDTAVRAFVSSGEIHMGLIMFSYMMGTMFFGFIGLFLGPIVLTLFWNAVHILVPYAIHGEIGEAP